MLNGKDLLVVLATMKKIRRHNFFYMK